jgi:hypothetical protein
MIGRMGADRLSRIDGILAESRAVATKKTFSAGLPAGAALGSGPESPWSIAKLARWSTVAVGAAVD